MANSLTTNAVKVLSSDDMHCHIVHIRNCSWKIFKSHYAVALLFNEV